MPTGARCPTGVTGFARLPSPQKPLRVLQKLQNGPNIKRHDQGKHPRRAAVHEERILHVPLGQSHDHRQHPHQEGIHGQTSPLPLEGNEPPPRHETEQTHGEVAGKGGHRRAHSPEGGNEQKIQGHVQHRPRQSRQHGAHGLFAGKVHRPQEGAESGEHRGEGQGGDVDPRLHEIPREEDPRQESRAKDQTPAPQKGQG